MLTSTTRVLRLLSLLQSRRIWTGTALAERLEITERTVRRDVDRLRALGYPVNSTSGVSGGYRLGAGGSMPPLLLDDDETLVVGFGLRMAATGALRGMEESTLRTLAKLEALLPARLKKRLLALQSAVTPLTWNAPIVDAGLLIALTQACDDRQVVRFGYEDRGGKTSRRHVEPHGVVHTGAHWYLAAFDLDRDDWRTFRVDRVSVGKGSRAAIDGTGRRFAPRPPPLGSLEAYARRSASGPKAEHRASVLLFGRYDDLIKRVTSTHASLERVDDDRCRLLSDSANFDALAYWLTTLGVDFEVEAPTALVTHLQTMADRLRRATERRPSTAQLRY